MNRRRREWLRAYSGPAALVIAALAASRLLVFFAVPQRDDLGSYPTWAREYKVAQQRNRSFYEVHEQEARRKSSAPGSKGGNPTQGLIPSNTRRWP